MDESFPEPEPRPRLVVIGRNSVLWTRIADRILDRRPDSLAVGHREIEDLDVAPSDHVWIFSYAPDEEANRVLFNRIRAKGAKRCFYISSATANVADRVHCYRYPRVKAAGERDAALILDAVPVRIGLIHDDVAELPSGTSAATRLGDLVATMVAPEELGRSAAGIVHLYELIYHPFHGAMESRFYSLYGFLLSLFGRYPCLLRPVDLLLRSLGWRWYGYFRLSNEQCRTTI